MMSAVIQLYSRFMYRQQSKMAIIISSQRMFDWLRPSGIHPFRKIDVLLPQLSFNTQNRLLEISNQDLRQNIADFNSLVQNLRHKLMYRPEDSSQTGPLEQSLERMLAIPQECVQFLNNPRAPKTKLIARYKNRGPYRSYSIQEKRYVAYLHSTGKTFASISKQLQIPQKNVVRWCREGYSAGSPRKQEDDSWEGRLAGWIHLQKDKSSITSKQIQDKAVQLSKNQRFKASQSWMKSFLSRYQLSGQILLKTSEARSDYN